MPVFSIPQPPKHLRCSSLTPGGSTRRENNAPYTENSQDDGRYSGAGCFARAIVSGASVMGLRELQASETLNASSGPGGLVANRRPKPFLVSPCHVCVKQCVNIMLQMIVYHYKSSNKRHDRRRLPLLSRGGGKYNFGWWYTIQQKCVLPIILRTMAKAGTRDERKKCLTGYGVGGWIGL